MNGVGKTCDALDFVEEVLELILVWNEIRDRWAQHVQQVIGYWGPPVLEFVDSSFYGFAIQNLPRGDGGSHRK